MIKFTKEERSIINAAKRLARRSGNTLITYKKTPQGTLHRHIVTWYDKQSKNYITQIKDENGQVGDAEYAGTREGAEFDHVLCVRKA